MTVSTNHTLPWGGSVFDDIADPELVDLVGKIRKYAEGEEENSFRPFFIVQL